jgi:hypothetical protein
MVEPRFNDPFIMVETPEGQVVDLYNESRLRSVIRRDDELVFEFVAASGYGSTDSTLRFLGVRELSVAQPEDWDPREAQQIKDLMIRPSGPWKRVVFKAGGLEYEFNASELRVEVEPATS